MAHRICSTLRERMCSSRFFLRMMLSYFLILIILFGMVIFFFQHVYAGTRADLLAQSHADLQEKGGKLSSELDGLHTSAILLLQNSLVRASVKPYQDLTVRDRENLRAVITMLSDLTQQHSIVEDTYLYADTSKVLTDTALFDQNLFFLKWHVYGDFAVPSPEDFPISFAFQLVPFTSLTVSDQRDMDVLPITVCDRTTGIILVYDVRLSRVLDELSAFREEYQYYFIRFHDTVLGANPDDPVSLSAATQNPDRYAIRSYECKNGLTVFCVNDLDHIQAFVRSRYESLVYIFLCAYALLLFIAILLCVLMYRPVTRLKQVVSITPESKELKGSEIDAVARAYEHMADKYTSLQSEFMHMSSHYRNASLETILFFHSLPSSDESPDLELLLDLKGSNMRCLYLEQTVQSQEQGLHALAPEYMETVKRLWGPEGSCYILRHGIDSCILVISRPDLTDTETFRFAEQIITNAQPGVLHIGIGHVCRSLQNLQESFHSAETACSYASDMMPIQSAEESYETVCTVREEEIARLIRLIETGDTPKVFHILDDWRNMLISQRVVSHAHRQLYYTVYKHLASLPLPDASLLKEHINELEPVMDYGHLGIGCSLREYEQTLWAIISEACNHFTPDRTPSAQKVSDAMEYIAQHYDENIGLAEVSTALGISASYLSKIFKDETGNTLSDYLAHLRIRHACAYLEETDLPIQSISEKVGIFSRSTFLRLFRNIVGVSPSEYKKMQRTKRSD